MRGELYINGKDAWDNWKVKLIEDSWDNILIPTNQKEYIENKNRGEHGKRVWIRDVLKEERTIQFMFAITCDSRQEYLQKYQSFVDELNSGWIVMSIPILNKSYKLIFPEFLDLSTGVGIIEGKLSVRFTEPNPNDRTAIDENGEIEKIFTKPFDITFN